MPIRPTCVRRRGTSLPELLCGLAAVVVLVALAGPALGGTQAGGRDQSIRSVERSARDGRHVQQIHQTMIIWASEAGGSMPRPGLVDRQPVDGRELPGRGEEDTSTNTTANLFSTMIMQNYFTPELTVSPLERNPRVTRDDDYDYELYSPRDDRYWDPGFVADLDVTSNVSYAHLVLTGQRVGRLWNDGMSATAVVLGNRGPAEGKRDVASFTTDPHGFWSGHLVRGDNHVTLERDPAPRDDMALPRATEDAPVVRDNVFAMETGPKGSDVVLAFTKAMGADGPVRQYD